MIGEAVQRTIPGGGARKGSASALINAHDGMDMYQQTVQTVRQPMAPGRRCHSGASTRCELGESMGDARIRFWLVRLLRDPLRDNEFSLCPTGSQVVFPLPALRRTEMTIWAVPSSIAARRKCYQLAC